jgi:hypothetical protein
MSVYGELRGFEIIWRDPRSVLIFNTDISYARTSGEAEQQLRDWVKLTRCAECEIVSVTEIKKERAELRMSSRSGRDHGLFTLFRRRRIT